MKGRVELLYGQLLFDLNHNIPAMVAAKRSLKEFEVAGPLPEVAAAYCLLGQAAWARGNHDHAYDMFNLAVKNHKEDVKSPTLRNPDIGIAYETLKTFLPKRLTSIMQHVKEGLRDIQREVEEATGRPRHGDSSFQWVGWYEPNSTHVSSPMEQYIHDAMGSHAAAL